MGIYYTEKRSENYKIKIKMIRIYTHSAVRNAFLKSAVKQLTTLSHSVMKCTGILEFEAGLLASRRHLAQNWHTDN